MTGNQMREAKYKKGFTLVELLVALMVTSIVLTAVATLAYAMGAANDASDDRAEKQAQVRYATLRISELIRHCRLIYDTLDDGIVIWKADDNDDDVVDAPELVYIEAGSNRDYISLKYGETSPEFYLIPQCSNVQFVLDMAAPQTQFISISFDLDENDVVHQYQINAALRGWAGNLLDDSGNIVSDDD